jgi:hypothetical protein
MSAREHIKIAAMVFAFEAASALHPGLWARLQRAQRKRLARPVWRHVAGAMAGMLVLTAFARYVERERERLREEDPELFAEMEAAAKRG